MSLTTIRDQTRIDLKVKLEFSDTLRAAGAIFARRARFAITLYALVLAVVLSLLLIRGSAVSAGFDMVWLAGLLIALPVVPLVFLYWNTKTQFRRSGGLKLHYYLCPGGLDIGSDARAGWLPWEAFVQAMETKSSFLLFLSPQEHYVLPKRCFRDQAQVGAARALLRQELGPKFRAL